LGKISQFSFSIIFSLEFFLENSIL
jgi:hypothetical protein